ncbi:acyl--CoA ligase [Patescibacteria group bacterium]|nr:acyl--CoA ligase [Patescibacteria group bacterium]
MKNLHTHISELAKKQPDRAALFSCGPDGRALKQYTYKELKEYIERVGSWFENDLGLQKGEVIGIAMPNSPDLLMLSWAAWAMGIVTVPLDIKRDTLSQYLYKLKLTQTKVLIAEQGTFAEKDLKAVKKVATIVEVNIPQKAKDVSWMPDLSHTALYLFTSGTTAAPKGAELSLENLIANAEGIVDWLGIKDTDRFLALLPLYHINSTTFCLSVLLAKGSIAVPPGYSNSQFWQQLAETRSTFTSIVPTICFDQLSQEKEFKKWKNKLVVNRIQIGSAPVVVGDAQQFSKQFSIPLYQGYGQTETALRVTGVPMNMSKNIYEKLVEENSIGKEMKHAEIKIMDEPEGEIAVKGPIVMKGYLHDEKANKDAFKNGYFLTGDIGYAKTIQGTKYFFLKGRSKEIIIKGGINLSPVAIESKLKKLNTDINQVYVIGVPDKRYGEEVAAVICWKSKNKEADLRYQLTSPQSIIMPIEIPQYITTLFEKDLPTTSTGKIQRAVLKNMIPLNKFQQVNLVAENRQYRFLRLTLKDKPFMKQVLKLHNYCWHPLVTRELSKGFTIAAVDKKGNVQGIITVLRTSLSDKELSEKKYDELEYDEQGKKLLCISICSNSYRQPKEKPKDIPIPSVAQMKAYVSSDPVYRFHQKPKGGLKKGARLVKMLPNSREEDKMALGYNMLLKYPKSERRKSVKPNENASVAVQLIEAVMRFGQELGIREVYAFSRPIGAYKHFS